MKKCKIKLDDILQDNDAPNPTDYLNIPSNKSNKSVFSQQSHLESLKSFKNKRSQQKIQSILMSNRRLKSWSSIQNYMPKSQKSNMLNQPYVQNQPQSSYMTQQALKIQIGQGKSSHNWNLSSQYSQNLQNLKSPTIRTKATNPKNINDASKLKNIIAQNKINGLVINFVNKLRRNNIYSEVIDNRQLQQKKSFFKFLDHEGIDLNVHIQRIFSLILILSMFGYIYYLTLMIIFSISSQKSQSMITVFITAVHLLDGIMNSITIKTNGGHRLTIIKEILKNYYENHNMILDIFLMMALTTSIFVEQILLTILILGMALFKMPTLIGKLQKLENHFISTIYMEQYWSLLKIFLFNFCYAHILAILLTLIARSNDHSNWITVKNIAGNNWYEIYIWSYYWAVNIMLTVGFGDIVPTNHIQALCLIFIQTISCIVLAYNINNVGSLISNIRAQQLQKNKKYKIFRNLSNKNQISNDLTLKIQNFIEESNNIKKKFNIEEEHKFVDNLPKVYKKEYLKQSNKKVFRDIFYFRGINEKAIQSLAQAIEIYVTHPQEIILGCQDYLSLKILKRGSIGYSAKKPGSKLNNKIVEKIKIQQGGLPLIIGLQFILRRRPNYEIKSLEYSIIYHLAYEKLISHLKNSNRDYEYYCYLRDKSKYHLDEFEIIKCQYCKYKHTKFDCPKLHFIPLKQHVIAKNIHKEKVNKNKRNPIDRIQFRRFNSLAQFLYIDSFFNPKNNDHNQNRKDKNFILNQFQAVDTINIKSLQSKNYQDIILSDDNQSLIRNITNITTEAIKKEMIYNKKKQNEEDEVWDLSLDFMQNFKSYFPSSNPCNVYINLQEPRSLCDIMKKKHDSKNNELSGKISYNLEINAFKYDKSGKQIQISDIQECSKDKNM